MTDEIVGITYYEAEDYSVGMIGGGYIRFEHNLTDLEYLDVDEMEEIKSCMNVIAELLLGDIGYVRTDEEIAEIMKMEDEMDFDSLRDGLMHEIVKTAEEGNMPYGSELEIEYTKLWIEMHELKRKIGELI
jgi:hypothetical protein